MIVSLRTQRRALAVPRRAGQICGLLRWMRICKTIGASAGASPRPTLGAALYDRCCAKRSFPILLRQPGWHFTIGIRDSRGCSLHNTKSVGGHIRPNRKFARTSFSKSFFMVFTCLIRTGLVQKITGELVISSPEKQHGRVLMPPHRAHPAGRPSVAEAAFLVLHGMPAHGAQRPRQPHARQTLPARFAQGFAPGQSRAQKAYRPAGKHRLHHPAIRPAEPVPGPHRGSSCAIICSRSLRAV